MFDWLSMSKIILLPFFVRLSFLHSLWFLSDEKLNDLLRTMNHIYDNVSCNMQCARFIENRLTQNVCVTFFVFFFVLLHGFLSLALLLFACFYKGCNERNKGRRGAIVGFLLFHYFCLSVFIERDIASSRTWIVNDDNYSPLLIFLSFFLKHFVCVCL